MQHRLGSTSLATISVSLSTRVASDLSVKAHERKMFDAQFRIM
jgi:hypothetical protein